MSKLKNKYGDWAMVAGAAKGIGEAYSKSLAAEGFNLIMVDDKEHELNIFSDKLIKEYAIKILPIHIDLNESDAVSRIMVSAEDIDCRLLIYNAAFSRVKKFIHHTPNEIEQVLNVNISSQIKLVHAFSNRLIAKKLAGGIILMSSLAGLLGMQLIAPYAASKAFAWNLAESLHYELKPFHIDVTACIAGATATEAYLSTDPKYGMIKPQVQKPEEVVKTALKNLGKNPIFISGFSNRINYFMLTRLLPRKLASYFANKTMRNMYPNN